MQNIILSRTIPHLFLIAVFSLIAYSNTFETPFLFDGEHYIVENPVIKDLHNFVQPSSSKDFTREFNYKTFSRRYLSYLSFALNYRLHGLNVAGYHIVNLSVHILTSLLLYFIIILTFKTPYLRNSAMREYARYIALFTALLFACHPLQTQAVTYIWQRVTSLCTMFYLLSLVAYIKWRLLTLSAERSVQGDKVKEKRIVFLTPGPVLFYLLSLASAILAMKTKEIAFMLPVMLVLYEMIFFEGKIKKRVLYLLPFLVTMLIVPLTTISGAQVEDLDSLVRGTTRLPRGEYLLAQFRVLVTYLRLIFLPVNQNLYYDYPRYYSFFNIEVFSSFVFLATLLGLSIYILYRFRDTMPHTRLISFGIIWFFISLLLESSIIPLHNVIFEHRMYLPSVGVFLALTVVIFMEINRRKAYARVIAVMLATIIIVLTSATYARNTVWKDKITLWQDVVNKSPNKEVAHYNLGSSYQQHNLLDKAIESYEIALTLEPAARIETYYNLAVAYRSKGMVDKAIQQYKIVINLKSDHYNAHTNLGIEYNAKGLTEKAIKHYKTAIRIKPDEAKPYNSLGNAYASKGLPDKAIEQYLIAIKLDPYYAAPYINLGNAYASKGLLDKAMKHYQTTIKLESNNPLAHYNIGRIYHMKGSINSAIKHYLQAIKLKPDYAKAHRNLGAAYKSKGDIELAIKAYNRALRFQPGWELPRKELEEISKER
jgi:tetratricopeptide (TPR) repeat protein